MTSQKPTYMPRSALMYTAMYEAPVAEALRTYKPSDARIVLPRRSLGENCGEYTNAE